MENQQNQETQKFRDAHTSGWKGIFKIYTLADILKSRPFIFSICFSAVISFCLQLSDDFFSKDYVIKTANFIVGIFPDLLGFNLGGYALIVGVTNVSLISAMSNPMKGKSFSLYQKTIAIFAFSIILQAGVLLMAFCVSYFSDIKFHSFNFSVSKTYFSIINCGIIFILTLLASWAIFMVISLAINIFTFGQLNHFFIKLEEMKPKEQSETEIAITKMNSKMGDVTKKQEQSNKLLKNLTEIIKDKIKSMEGRRRRS